MKKHTLILSAVTVLALAAMSCGIQFVGSNPTPVPQQQIPQNFNPQVPDNVNPENQPPQGPDNGNPPPQGPNNGNPPQGPDNGNPPPQGPGQSPNGGGNILAFTADHTTLNQGQCTILHWETQGGFGARLNGQPVERSGQQQVCPPQTTLYRLELDTGGQMLPREVTITVTAGGQLAPQATQPAPTKKPKNKPTAASPSNPNPTPTFLVLQIAKVDLAISNIYPSSTGHIMVTVKNVGNMNVSGSYKIVCSGSYIDSGGNNALKLAGQYASVNLAPGKSQDYDTSYSRNPSIQHMYVQCTLTPPQADTNKSNDSMGPTQVK